jgi:hypothetical protein
MQKPNGWARRVVLVPLPSFRGATDDATSDSEPDARFGKVGESEFLAINYVMFTVLADKDTRAYMDIK